MTTPDLMAHAQRLLDENRYLTLGTTSSEGRPRTSPVYFAADGVQDFYWISGVDARHSRNLTERPPVSLVVLDSAAAPYEGRAVYATGHARELTGDEMAAGLAVDPAPNLPRVPPLTREDVSGSSAYRLYQATATDLWVLCPREPRQPCPQHGIAHDHRARIDLSAEQRRGRPSKPQESTEATCDAVSPGPRTCGGRESTPSGAWPSTGTWSFSRAVPRRPATTLATRRDRKVVAPNAHRADPSIATGGTKAEPSTTFQKEVRSNGQFR